MTENVTKRTTPKRHSSGKKYKSKTGRHRRSRYYSKSNSCPPYLVNKKRSVEKEKILNNSLEQIKELYILIKNKNVSIDKLKRIHNGLIAIKQYIKG